MHRIQILSSCLFALALGLFGCGGESKVTIKLTDAPGDYKRAVVTISEVELLGDGENNRVVLLNQGEDHRSHHPGERHRGPREGRRRPRGTYRLRFVITGAFIEVDDGNGGTKICASSPTYEGLPEGAQVAGSLQMPSYGTSGLKVKIAEPVTVEGEQKVILVDFDVAQSFGHGRYRLGEVDHEPRHQGRGHHLQRHRHRDADEGRGRLAAHRGGPGHHPGQLRGRSPTRAVAPERLAFTDANGDGVFEAQFVYLIPGDFSVGVVGPAGVNFSTNPASPAPVSVGNGKQVGVAFTLTSASAR